MIDWKTRRKIAYKLYNGLFDDVDLPHVVIDNQTDEQLASQVINFFENGSELIYPAKFIFCNIVYSYYLNKYFDVPFYQALNDVETLYDSPCVILYNDRKNVYDIVLAKVLPNFENFNSIKKTRHYFKMEFLVDDEDITDVCPNKFLKNA